MNGSAPESPVFWRAHGIVALLDTSVLVRAWLSPAATPIPSQRIMLLAGVAYDSFTSPAILEEVEEVLEKLRFGAARARVRAWLDAYLRSGRQAFPQPFSGTMHASAAATWPTCRSSTPLTR